MKVDIKPYKSDSTNDFKLVEVPEKIQRNILWIEKPERSLDCRLLSSPIPTIKLRTEINKVQLGQTLEIRVTDLNSKDYIQKWCNKTGNKFLEFPEKCGVVRFIIQRLS